MKSEGEQMRKKLLAGATILEVATLDLRKYEGQTDKIVTIQATMRGHLERKRLQHRKATVCWGHSTELIHMAGALSVEVVTSKVMLCRHSQCSRHRRLFLT
jgi:hypothetical protein